MGSSLIRVLTILIILTVSFLGSGQSVFNKAFDEANTANHTSNALEYADQYYFTQKAFIGGAAVLQAICLDSNGLVVKKKPLVVDSIKNIFYGYGGAFQRLSSNEFCQLYKTGGDSTLKLVFFDDSLDVIRTVEYALNLYSGPGIVKQTNDSTLLLLGLVSNPSNWDIVLINTDLQGNERWRTIFGEPGKDDYGFSIEIINNEIFVGGQTFYNSTSVANSHLFKLTSSGQLLNDTIYNGFNNGGFLTYNENYGLYNTGVVNKSNFLIPFLSLINSNNLSTIWEHTYFVDDTLVAPQQMIINDNGIISISGGKLIMNEYSGWFFQTNADGDSLGSKILEHIPNESAAFNDIRPTSDGGYILAGQTDAPTQDSWIVKVNAWGCDNIPCVVSVDEKEVSKGGLNCYPNPTNGEGTISGALSTISLPTEINVFNAMGQLVQTIPIRQKDFDLQVNIKGEGLYLVVLMQNGVVMQQQKWVVH